MAEERKKNDAFWTDLQQAQERLAGSVVLYDDSPVYIEALEDSAYEDGRIVPKARMLMLPTLGEKNRVKKFINSPHFHRFRDPVRLGWMNDQACAATLFQRRPATGRSHGLTSGNCSIGAFNTGASGSSIVFGSDRFTTLIFDKGFVDMHKGEYPSLDGILRNIEHRSSIAYSRVFCVHKDSDGVIWLYRHQERVGIFTGSDTLNLLGKFGYLREEIAADPAFTLNTIREM